jgi:hypothetical protein
MTPVIRFEEGSLASRPAYDPVRRKLNRKKLNLSACREAG